MALDNTIAGLIEGSLAVSQQGFAFVMEQGRIGMLEGKMGMREGLTQRIIGESGGGQARAFLPAGLGGAPTTGINQPKVGT